MHVAKSAAQRRTVVGKVGVKGQQRGVGVTQRHHAWEQGMGCGRGLDGQDTRDRCWTIESTKFAPIKPTQRITTETMERGKKGLPTPSDRTNPPPQPRHRAYRR